VSVTKQKEQCGEGLKRLTRLSEGYLNIFKHTFGSDVQVQVRIQSRKIIEEETGE
jgi:hypothetical protein